MNENIDLTKILKDCPKGTKLYSTIHGECELFHVDDIQYNYPIQIMTNVSIEYYTKEGKFNRHFNGECVLFPSKENRDWSTFKAPKEELSEICNYLECQKREEASRKSKLDKWIIFLKYLNIEQTATEGAIGQINRILNILDWAEEKGHISYSDWKDCYGIVVSLKYRLKKTDTNKN